MLNAGDLDVVFAGGKATANFSLGAAQVQALAVQADSKIVAVGQAGSSNSDFALARFNLNGTLDAGFGTAGEVITGFGANQNSAAKGVASRTARLSSPALLDPTAARSLPWRAITPMAASIRRSAAAARCSPAWAAMLRL